MDVRMRIGELAQRAGVTLRTIRYYESIGLMPPGDREGTGQHYYTEEALVRLQKINQLKKLGLSLDEIRDIVGLLIIDPSGVQIKMRVLSLLRHHLAETDRKVNELEQFRAELQGHIEYIERWFAEKTDN